MSQPLLLPADAGEPMSRNLVATSEVQHHKFPTATRQVSLRNTGTNTLWIRLPDGEFFDVAAGTSWDDRVSVRELWYCTQLGRTTFAIVGLALMSSVSSDEPRDSDQKSRHRRNGASEERR